MGKGKTNWLKSVLDSCEQRLSGRGVPCTRREAESLGFEMNGTKFMLSFHENDSTFLKLSAIFDGNCFSYSRQELLEAINSANLNTKVAKVYIDDGGNLDFSTELFLLPTTNFTNILDRHINAILACIYGGTEWIK